MVMTKSRSFCLKPRLRRVPLIVFSIISLLFISFVSSYAETINYVYDDLNRLIRVIYEDETVVQYTYDRTGNRLVQFIDTDAPVTTASPAGGIYPQGLTVTLSCSDGTGLGCDKIYYTTDGTPPTTSSSIYSAPIPILDMTLKFFATDLGGHSESVKTETYTVDETLPIGTISINSGAEITNSPDVTLALSCTDDQGCSEMQFSNDDVTYSTPEAYGTTKAWTLSSGDGTKTVYARFKDIEGQWSIAYSDSILLDTTPPTGSITINSGAPFTSSPNVMLTLTCEDPQGCSQMQFSNDDVTYSTPEAYGTTKAWTLSPGDGPKTVYVKFEDGAGNWSSAYSDSIGYNQGWLSGWSYRKPVTLSRASGAVSNYQMKLLVGETSGATGENVDCGGHIRSDFNDLRFTNSNGDLLNYWIESITGATPNQLATVWIKFDSIGTGATTFYMYYGNESASAYSNGANTFIVFDDFERGLNGDPIGGSWSNVNTQTISTDHSYGGTRSGKLPASSSNIWIGGSACTESRAVGIRMWKEDACAMAMGMWGVTNWNCRWYANGAEDIYTQDSILRDTGYNVTADAWGLFEIYDVNLTAHTYSLRYDGTVIGTNIPMMNASFGAFGFMNGDTTAGRDMYLDDYIVRSYANPEPAWGAWGAEETP